jgi:hypothetical protein
MQHQQLDAATQCAGQLKQHEGGWQLAWPSWLLAFSDAAGPAGWVDRFQGKPRKGCDILVQALEREVSRC